MNRFPGLPLPPPFSALPPPEAVARRVSAFLVSQAGRVPFSLQREALSRVMAQALKEPLEDGDFEFLQGKWLHVEILDAGLGWYFTYGEDERLHISEEQQADVAIRGNLKEFLQLTARTEDPDTLFFQRRLQIEGDTELGLEVKNLLDGVDQDGLPPILRLLMLRGAALAARLL